jgi:integrase
VKWRAKVRVKLPNGSRVDLERWAPTKAAAIAAAKLAINERLESAKAPGAARSKVTVGTVAAQWAAAISDDARLAKRTRDLYRGSVERYLLGSSLADMRIADATPGDVEDFLNGLAHAKGSGTAKTARSVLSQVFARAVRRGLCQQNTVRLAERTIEPENPHPTRPAARSHDRALEHSEALRLLWLAYRDDKARADGTADLMVFMLSTAARLGEALACRWIDVDWQGESISINATINRIDGGGLVRGATKTPKSTRIIPIPRRLSALLRRRLRDSGSSPDTPAPLFPSAVGTYLDTANTIKRMRPLFKAACVDWATGHTFRRTQATWLHESGVPVSVISDFLGHADIAMTMSKYFGRGSQSGSDLLRAAIR